MDDPAKNVERWKKLTYLMDYQDAGTAEAGSDGAGADECWARASCRCWSRRITAVDAPR